RSARAVPAELVLTYRLEERIPLDVGVPSPHIERWLVSVLERRTGGDDRVEIGYAHVLVFTLEPGRDISELADVASGTWIDVEALGRVWSKVGFRHWRDGVWMLDLSTDDMQATLAELVAARSRVDSGP